MFPIWPANPVSLKWNAASTLDTNVLVSGLLSPAGNEALIPLAIHQGLVRPCSEEILEGAIPVRMKTL